MRISEVLPMKTDKKEVNAIVLDVLQRGHPDDPRPVFKREALIQAVGISQFKLLELVPKSLNIQIHELVYIGDGEREKIERVKRRISYHELTQTAKVELPFTVEQLVKEKEPEFVQFFNKSISITPKLHMLHLLPGIGKKLMWEILTEREKKPFESFADISQRIKSIPHPEKMVVNRILEELQDPDVKYHVFTSK
jgi:putative nucleotide binding protein